jgi:hypothetical protein
MGELAKHMVEGGVRAERAQLPKKMDEVKLSRLPGYE